MGKELSGLLIAALLIAVMVSSGSFFINDTADNYNATTVNTTMIDSMEQGNALYDLVNNTQYRIEVATTSGNPLDYLSVLSNGMIDALKAFFSLPDIFTSFSVALLGASSINATLGATIGFLIETIILAYVVFGIISAFWRKDI